MFWSLMLVWAIINGILLVLFQPVVSVNVSRTQFRIPDETTNTFFLWGQKGQPLFSSQILIWKGLKYSNEFNLWAIIASLKILSTNFVFLLAYRVELRFHPTLSKQLDLVWRTENWTIISLRASMPVEDAGGDYGKWDTGKYIVFPQEITKKEVHILRHKQLPPELGTPAKNWTDEYVMPS